MNICIFCGSKKGNSETIRQDIIAFCDIISQNGFNLVYGGSKKGTMGLVAEIFRQNGRKIIGVRPNFFLQNEISYGNDIKMIWTETLSQRKMKMLEISDIVVALAGGTGTLDEITEAHSLSNLQQNKPMICILNSQNFYGGLIQHYENIEKFGYTKKILLNTITIESDPHLLAQKIIEYRNSKN